VEPEKKKDIRSTLEMLKGKVWMSDDFNDPLPPEILREFGIEGCVCDSTLTRFFGGWKTARTWAGERASRLNARAGHQRSFGMGDSDKLRSGRLSLTVDPEDSIPELLQTGFQPLPIQFRHALAVRHLPPHHKDPFDRMLVAQAQYEVRRSSQPIR
jgi:hypothetical protein